MFKIDRIDHFVMRVSDVEATCAFYSKALGMEVGYYDPYLPVGHDKSLDFNRFDSLSDLLGWADAVSVSGLSPHISSWARGSFMPVTSP